MSSIQKKTANNIILWHKKEGETSFQSLGKLKRELGTRKVGHTGTLDKFASGLLIVLSGKLTRLNPLFTGMDKCYRAEISFGAETDTLDPSGEIIYQADVPERERVEKELTRFIGPQNQIPPLYSAIHVNGKRAWKRALSGEEVEMKPRSIMLHRLEVIGWEQNRLLLDVECSKGTYIRSLARDLGLACGSRAHLTGLCRTSVGPFRLEQSWPGCPEGLMEAKDLPAFFPRFHNLAVEEEKVSLVKQGRDINIVFSEDQFPDEGYYSLYDPGEKLLAMVKKDKRGISYFFVVPS